MYPVHDVFPKFVPDQLLTANDLNNLFGYLDEQQRLTRTNLIGIGIVCGLGITVNPAQLRLTISKGCGVTSQGYLVALPETTYTSYKPYNIETEKAYPLFRYQSSPGVWEKVPVFQLFEAAVEEDTTGLSAEFLKDKVVMIFVELKETGNKNCDPNSCDDKGERVEVSFLPMLINKADAYRLMGAENLVFGADSYAQLPEMRLPRWDVKSVGPASSKAIISSYQEILSPDFVKSVEGNLTKCYQVFRTLVGAEFGTNPFDGLSATFSFLHSTALQPQQVTHYQYYYDLFSDLLQAYQELRHAGSHIMGTCCPNEFLFPRHLLLGEAVNTTGYTNVPLRHYFLHSPLFDMSATVQQVQFLFRRLVVMVNSFMLPAVQGVNAKLDGFIRITPSLLGKHPLSDKAIPYYYNVSVAGSTLYNSWSFKNSKLGNATSILSYHADKYPNTPDKFVLNPLEYDLEPYNFLRVEGIAGKPYTHVLRQVKRQIQQCRLPVDIIALTTASYEKLKGRFEDNQLIKADDHTILCYFQDLESMYDSMRQELLCTWCKELKYYYDFTIKLVNAYLKKLNVAGSPSEVELFNQCGNGYTIRTNSFGVLIEHLYREGLTDENLTIMSFLQAFGINLLDLDQDDVPDAFNNQIATALIALLNFFKLPLGIIRISSLLTEDLAEFDAAAYCKASASLAEYAQGLKSLFSLFTGGDPISKTADTTAKKVDEPVAAVAASEKAAVKSDGMQSTQVIASMASSANGMLRILAAILMIEDFLDHLDVVIYQCKCSALKSLRTDYEARYHSIARLRQFDYFSQCHPGLQHKAGVPMGGTFILVYHEEATEQSEPIVMEAELGRSKRGTNPAVFFESLRRAPAVEAVEPFKQIGFVVNELDEPVAGAVVQLQGSSKRFITDAEGSFRVEIDRLPVLLLVKSPGYRPSKTQVDDPVKRLVIQLREDLGDVWNNIPDGTVIADFYLPYRCCSDCQPVQFVINETALPEPPANQGPVAEAGPTQTVQLPKTTAKLSGDASKDPDGIIVSYEWIQLDGPVRAKIVNPQSAITDVTDLLEKGTYTFELTVKDDKGAINRDTVKVEVLPEPPPAPKAPIAEAGDSQQIELKRNGTIAQLDGTKSLDPDGEIVSYNWKLLNASTAVKIDFPNAPQTTVQFFTTGDYKFQLLVKDKDGLTATDEVLITIVKPEPVPPVADAGEKMVLPFNNNVVTLQLDGSKSFDPDGQIVSYQWTMSPVSTAVSMQAANSSKPTVQFFAGGTYKFILEVKDNDGLTANASVEVELKRESSNNKPPVANAGENRKLTLSPRKPEIELDGSQSFDPENKPLNYEWKLQGNQSGVIIKDANKEKTSVVVADSGIYTFVLLIKDDAGQTATDNVTVEVTLQGDIDLPVEKDCGSIEELSARFAKYNFKVGEDGLYNAFAEVFGQYGQVQRFFDYLNSKQGEPIEDLIKNLAAGDFESQDIPKLFQSWFEFIQGILVENNDLRKPAFELYWILLKVCLYLICVQQSDINKQGLDFRDLLKMLMGHWQTWKEMAKRQAWSEEDLKMIKQFEELLSATKMELERTGEALIKKQYYKWISEVLNIFTA